MNTDCNQIKHTDAEARAAYAKKHEAIRIEAYEDANKRLPQILEGIHSGWAKRAIFCGPIDEQAIQDYKAQWKSNVTTPAVFNEHSAQTFGRFDWENSVKTYDKIKSRFEVSVYAGNKLAALSFGGWRNWHGHTNGQDVTTNFVCIDTVEVTPKRSLALPGLSLVAIAEAARSYARLTNRDVFALNGPSKRMQKMLRAVGFPKIEGRDLYMMPVEDLDLVWKNLSQYLSAPSATLPYRKSLTKNDARSLLRLPGNEM